MQLGIHDAAELIKLPDTRPKRFSESFILKNKQTGEVVANRPYRITLANGETEDGITDEKGYTHAVMTAAQEILKIEIED